MNGMERATTRGRLDATNTFVTPVADVSFGQLGAFAVAAAFRRTRNLRGLPDLTGWLICLRSFRCTTTFKPVLVLRSFMAGFRFEGFRSVSSISRTHQETTSRSCNYAWDITQHSATALFAGQEDAR
ncbi:MAG: hypothetical protein ACREQB_06390, partial [Candidatus Binataceae bacterium]